MKKDYKYKAKGDVVMPMNLTEEHLKKAGLWH